MPNYDYLCGACGHALVAFQKITDAPLMLCPLCRQESLRRGIGGGATLFRFVGSGFYANDYKKKECERNQGTCSSCSADAE